MRTVAIAVVESDTVFIRELESITSKHMLITLCIEPPVSFSWMCCEVSHSARRACCSSPPSTRSSTYRVRRRHPL